MSELSEHEVIRRFVEGLKMSADAARMLGVMQRNSDFLGIGRIIDEIATNGTRLATSKSMTEQALKQGLVGFSALNAAN